MLSSLEKENYNMYMSTPDDTVTIMGNKIFKLEPSKAENAETKRINKQKHEWRHN